MNFKQFDHLLDTENTHKLEAIGNPRIHAIIEEYAKLCDPSRITVVTDCASDHAYVRARALEAKEEIPLDIPGHTMHFDGPLDQGRDAANTKLLLTKGQTISPRINTGDRDTCLEEIRELLGGSMTGKEMFVCFFCLGPTQSPFSLLALQITDSAYVAHSESILYRSGYSSFCSLTDGGHFFHFIHSGGSLVNGVSAEPEKKRIYIDLEEERVFSVNTQYAGNSIGLKKLALRLAIKKSSSEEWLCEHMFIMGIHPRDKDRVTYFTGAYPSGCGKTSTAMVPGQSIVGDDLAYLKPGKDGMAYAANPEQGIFGIIEDVNAEDDPLIHQALSTPREIIFSNMLLHAGRPWWSGMGEILPVGGINHTGQWKSGMRDSGGKEIPAAHKNARYTLHLKELANADPHLNDANGVPISGVIYGGRDPDTSVPVLESFTWAHGVVLGAALESETTAQTLGAAGIRKHNPMANLDFLVIPLGLYIQNHLAFGARLDRPPRIFATNYFLQHEGRFLNKKTDKKAWLLWMEGRVHGEYGAVETPVGFIPRFEDIMEIFASSLGRTYTKEAYETQFAIRIAKLLERLDRIEAAYKEELHIPEALHEHLEHDRERLLKARKDHGRETIPPSCFV